MNEIKTYPTPAHIAEGGSYELRDGVFVRVQEPTVTAEPAREQGADAGPGAALGSATGEPPARAEASEPAPRTRGPK